MNRNRFLVLALTIVSGVSVMTAVQTVSFLGRSYVLASFNQKAAPMWEFTSGKETVGNWTNLLTLLERPDAKTKQDLDRLAQGVMDHYKANGGNVLMARTMGSPENPYNYIVVAFTQATERRIELNFVKVALGPKNAYVVIYGERIHDPKDPTAKAKAFLNERSAEIGMALEKAILPEIETLPRKEF